MEQHSFFVRALGEVISGSTAAEHFAQKLVRAAVEHALDKVYVDYGVRIRDSEVDAIVQQYSCLGINGDATKKCEGTNTKGKQCGQRAFIGGFCAFHQDQREALEVKRRKLAMYKGLHTSKKKRDPYACLATVPEVTIPRVRVRLTS